MREAASCGRNSFQNSPAGLTLNSAKSMPAATAWAAENRSGFCDEARVSFIAKGQLLNGLASILGFVARLGDQAVLRRLAAHRVGVAGIARQHEGLAAAAAEVLFLFIAGAARLGHPFITAKPVETERLVPDVLHAVIAHVGELDRHLARAVTGQGGAVRSHGEEQIAPAVHAGFRALFVIVGGDEDQFDWMVLGGRVFPVLVWEC